jgi:hypothetical protein
MIWVVARMVPYASSPSISLLKVRFLWFLVALNVRSHIHICMVKVLDKEESVPHGLVAWYGQVLPIMEKPLAMSFHPGAWKSLEWLYHFKISYFFQYGSTKWYVHQYLHILGYCGNKHKGCTLAP